ncbi:GGDEF domain-containing protein [Caballeronia sp. Lep1P3]|uniref:GGDEF domain-containing protein n=1 Tax=Caballeronia sp. Lep1P3 TaxID=2878150 RepID=UPI001FD3B898
MLSRVAVGNANCCVGLLDLDHFKNINDTHGHVAGDAALRQFARYCASSLISQAFVSRLGGEEFITLFQGIRSEDAKVELERILSAIPPIALTEPRGITLKLSFSAGLAEARCGDRQEDVLSRADKALYAAKQAGRRRVEIFRPSARELL